MRLETDNFQKAILNLQKSTYQILSSIPNADKELTLLKESIEKVLNDFIEVYEKEDFYTPHEAAILISQNLSDAVIEHLKNNNNVGSSGYNHNSSFCPPGSGFSGYGHYSECNVGVCSDNVYDLKVDVIKKYILRYNAKLQLMGFLYEYYTGQNKITLIPVHAIQKIVDLILIDIPSDL